METGRDRVVEQVAVGEWGSRFFKTLGCELLPDEQYFESLGACLVCGSDKLGFLLKKGGMTVDRCQECGFGFQNPCFRAERLHEIYVEPYLMENVYLSPVALELDELKFLYGVQQVLELRSDIRSVLDVGCGPGLSLQTYRRAGIPEVFGLEPGVYTVPVVGDWYVVREFFAEVPTQFRNLSLITMWDVLEHIHDFKSLLAFCWRALDLHGLLLVMVLNLLSLATRLVRERSPTFQVDHLNYFTERFLWQTLHLSGFDVLMSETVISEIDNCRNYLEFQEPYLSFSKGELAFGWLSSEYIHAHMLGSRLLVVARKSVAVGPDEVSSLTGPRMGNESDPVS